MCHLGLSFSYVILEILEILNIHIFTTFFTSVQEMIIFQNSKYSHSSDKSLSKSKFWEFLPYNKPLMDEADVNPAVPGSSRHTRIIEDEENKPSAITKSSERSCQEDYSGKNNLGHDAETTTGIKAKHSRREVSSSATMNTSIKHDILKTDQLESNQLETSIIQAE